jgi:hypothetical protein
MSAKVISLLLSRLSLRRTGERVGREKHLDPRLDDAVRSVNAEKEREREVRRKRVVVDDFTKRRQEQFALAFGLLLVAMGDRKPQVEQYDRKGKDENNR